jgi:hypothetical protein
MEKNKLIYSAMKINQLCENQGCEVELPSMPLAKIILGLLEVENPSHIPPLPYGVSQIVTFDIDANDIVNVFN